MDNIRYGQSRRDGRGVHCGGKARQRARLHHAACPTAITPCSTDNGANLSQGQRQLLSIARAAVADPPGHDPRRGDQLHRHPHGGYLVQRGMDALMKGRTVFVIAHRLSTVQNSDAIMVLDHGRIIERGTHDDLHRPEGHLLPALHRRFRARITRTATSIPDVAVLMQKVCRGGALLRPAECGCSIEILDEFGCICVFGCRGRCPHRPGRMHRFYGNLRRIRNFPTGRCGHRPLQDAARICGFPSGRASFLPTALGSGILAVILLHPPEFSL